MEPSDPATIYEVILATAFVILGLWVLAGIVVWGLIRLSFWVWGRTWRGSHD